MTETDASSIRVLVVDDQRTMRDIFRRLLSQIGVDDVNNAADGEQALEKLHNPTADKPDIVICNLHMEKMDGMDFCNHEGHSAPGYPPKARPSASARKCRSTLDGHPHAALLRSRPWIAIMSQRSESRRILPDGVFGSHRPENLFDQHF